MSENLPEVRNVTDLQQGQASPEELRMRMSRMTEMIKLKGEFLRENLKEGLESDYAVIPGCGDKKVLLKPGAEKLLDWHGYYADFSLISEKEDWETGIFAYTYRCTIKQRGSNIVIATQEGDASTQESKYRYEWKFENQLPANVDKGTLTKREVGKNRAVMYRVVVDNPADRRNTVRKMAQKRALIGATVLATATSSLFSTDIEPEDDGATHEATGNGQGQAQAPNPDQYGKVISDAQAKRAYAKAKSANLDIDNVNAWLFAKYGFENINAIGWKAYEEVCKILDSGKLPTVEPEHEEQTEPSAGKITMAQLKDLAARLGTARKSESQFKEWLGIAYPQYAGHSTNDILAADYPAIIGSFIKAAQEGAL